MKILDLTDASFGQGDGFQAQAHKVYLPLAELVLLVVEAVADSWMYAELLVCDEGEHSRLSKRRTRSGSDVFPP